MIGKFACTFFILCYKQISRQSLKLTEMVLTGRILKLKFKNSDLP